jgi:hypothetical protein
MRKRLENKLLVYTTAKTDNPLINLKKEKVEKKIQVLIPNKKKK